MPSHPIALAFPLPKVELHHLFATVGATHTPYPKPDLLVEGKVDAVPEGASGPSPPAFGQYVFDLVVNFGLRHLSMKQQSPQLAAPNVVQSVERGGRRAHSGPSFGAVAPRRVRAGVVVAATHGCSRGDRAPGRRTVECLLPAPGVVADEFFFSALCPTALSFLRPFFAPTRRGRGSQATYRGKPRSSRMRRFRQ